MSWVRPTAAWAMAAVVSDSGPASPMFSPVAVQSTSAAVSRAPMAGSPGHWCDSPQPLAILRLCADALSSRPAEKVSAGSPAWVRAWLMSASTWSAGVPCWLGAEADGDAAGPCVAWAVALPGAAAGAAARAVPAVPARPGAAATLTGILTTRAEPSEQGAPAEPGAPAPEAPAVPEAPAASGSPEVAAVPAGEPQGPGVAVATGDPGDVGEPGADRPTPADAGAGVVPAPRVT